MGEDHHDYERNGTTLPFAAHDVATGKVIGQCYLRYRSSEFRKFLDRVEANVPPDLEIHIVVDNYSPHETKTNRDWFARRPRWHVHSPPMCASWLSQIVHFFAGLTEKPIQRGVHPSIADLEWAITEHIETVNQDPQDLTGSARQPVRSWRPSGASASGPSNLARPQRHSGSNFGIHDTSLTTLHADLRPARRTIRTSANEWGTLRLE